jgi:hypothetical protein
MSATEERRFFVARNADVSAAEVLLAKASPRERIEDAVADMGEGVVFDSSGEIVAFHERHARWIEHRAQRSGTPRMAHARSGS